MYSVYIHLNRANNKRYIGITRTSTSKRWANGLGYRKQKYFYNAIKKYGWDGFEHIVVKDGLPEQCAKTFEKVLIKLFDTTNPEKGYNQSTGGEGRSGFVMSEEQKIKISESLKGLQRTTFSDEHKSKISKAHLGSKHSDETKKKMSNSHIGRKVGGKVPKAILQLQNGIIIAEYPSAKEAAKAIGKDRPDGIWKAVKNNKKYLDYEWQINTHISYSE